METEKMPGHIGWKTWMNGPWRLRIIVALGLLGMALVLFSSFTGADKTPQPTETAATEFVSGQYAAELEERLAKLIAGIEGAGRTQIMVTLESGVEYVYVQEEKRSADREREGSNEMQPVRISEKENVEQTYIFVEQDGGQQPLLQTELQPKVQGVVIVCEGADDVLVRQSLINVVTTALDISSSKVCVAKIETDSME